MEKKPNRTTHHHNLVTKLNSGKAELIAIYGRWRTGKTFIVRDCFKDLLVFEIVGIHDKGFRTQLENFSYALSKAPHIDITFPVPDNWTIAFEQLDYYIDNLSLEKAAVIFFDELPWIYTQKSGFLEAFYEWWTLSASQRPNIKIVLSGSDVSWMKRNIINAKGILHACVTDYLRLEPFSLFETEEFLKNMGCKFDKLQVLLLYMALGGIPYYLKNISEKDSFHEIMDKMFFKKENILKNEFSNICKTMFGGSGPHEKIIRAVCKTSRGLTRKQIIKACNFKSGGTTSRLLHDLAESGVITAFNQFHKNSNDFIYKISDEYCLFFLKIVEINKGKGAGAWQKLLDTLPYRFWSEMAFESVCLKHWQQVKAALEISGVKTEISKWRDSSLKKNKKVELQIEFILERADQCINLCEMKFATRSFLVDKKFASRVDNKVSLFKSITKTKSTIVPIIICPFGIYSNEYSVDRFPVEIVLKDLLRN